MLHFVGSIFRCRLLRRFCLVGALVMVMGSQAHATTYATWMMIWIGHDQAWWKGNSPLIPVNGEMKQLDWADNSQIEVILDGIKKAGVTVVIADLTNGWGWLDGRCQYIQSLCAKKGMKFCVAENSGGNTASFESHASDIWKNLAGPDAPNHEAYFHYRGKPLIVCYAVRDWYKSYLKMDTPARSHFSLVWSSGEDSSINKWGWQLEPWVGAIPSKDSMFVTPSVRWNPGNGLLWRKSMAWLDYNFALAKKTNPEYVIVGSYDESERNAWMVQDLNSNDIGARITDKTGALSKSAHYDRVSQWIKGKPPVTPGGLLRDGAYRVINRANGKHLGTPKDDKQSQGAAGTRLIGCAQDKAPMNLFWLYHLGGNQYRVITLHSGLALESTDGVSVVQNWDTTDSNQRWTLTRTKDGYFRLKNNASGKMLSLEGEDVTLESPDDEQNQQWSFRAVLTM